MIVEYIDAHKDRLGVEPICNQLQIAPSTYYAAKTRPPSARSVSDAATTAVIAMVHAENYGVYGARKVHAELGRQGHRVARCTVQRLMRTAGLRGISRAKDPRTTIPGPGPDLRPDLVERSFTATGPNQLWVADITYCPTSWIPAVIATPTRRGVGDAGEEVHRGAAGVGSSGRRNTSSMLGVVLSSTRRMKKGPGRRPQSAKRQRFMELRARGWSIAAVRLRRR